MAYIPRQIGWNRKANLLQEMLRKLSQLTQIAGHLTTTTTTTSPSDIRLKTNIIATGNMRGLLREYTWEWNATAKSLNLEKYPTIGILAQEAKEVYPEAVSFSRELGYYVVDYNKIPC